LIDSHVLVIDDDADILVAAQLLLKRHFRQVDVERNPQRIPYWVNTGQYNVFLLDINFNRDVTSSQEGFIWLDKILDLDPNAIVVLMTAYGDVEMAVRAIKAGASDFVLKPWDNAKLLHTLQSAIVLRREGGRHIQAAPVIGHDDPAKIILGDSQAMQRVLDTVRRVAPTDANVLVLGENGTGKDLVARAIHALSGRSKAPFVPVDLGSISESLFESELFGHTKGAFTDAREDRAGRFEEAHMGTLFLDEIGNIPLPLQAKLLTILQQRQVTRVGTNKAKPIDVRLVCATNEPIYKRVEERTFRQDLLYRVNTIEVTIPPLRERAEDIPLLANHFLRLYRKQYNRDIQNISPAALQRLVQYNWPGNVRELRHAIERAVILAQGAQLEAEDFFFRQEKTGSSNATAFGETFQLDEMEKQLLRRAIQKHQGNVSDIARELGISRQAVYRRMEKYGL
jgi:two-component system, NtrC family, response regulator HydG